MFLLVVGPYVVLWSAYARLLFKARLKPTKLYGHLFCEIAIAEGQVPDGRPEGSFPRSRDKLKQIVVYSKESSYTQAVVATLGESAACTTGGELVDLITYTHLLGQDGDTDVRGRAV